MVRSSTTLDVKVLPKLYPPFTFCIPPKSCCGRYLFLTERLKFLLDSNNVEQNISRKLKGVQESSR